ncbi:Pyrroline-5-carboxylate reductase [Wickerhamomyces ciferrii]|uniref:Pyrroline-5-carboxylate reductase n=1 Tax=Wickerhamomyces ciferrii (strain ATCC 14091 / BCRC 22168 / CBS 111 / JCM 3599 / NBRC 0793 / NRRL Y-1031 F-60-10) TaxID=1206466 RepID=K0KPF5_WICCF|nr:Pyrroline-5-carboxylate reductase [Wickerhamomyces ciferrii]CCH44846.1 Pyrroline-5-carboxylate reductase [Wickerhamomyces ciferrii]
MSYEKGKPYTLAVLGAGTIGQALLSAYLSSENPELPPTKIIACVRSESSAQALVTQYKDSPIPFETSYGEESNNEAVLNSQVVIIGTKPYVTESALEPIKDQLKGKLLISMVAGWTIEQFETYSSKISRVMTNTPAKYQYGTAVISNSLDVNEDERELIKALVTPIGKVVELPEKNMDAATALVGSGPAFVLTMLEGLVESGLSLGIPFKESLECSIKVMEGTAKMAEISGTHPGELKHKVCTPGGTTIAGCVEMDSHGVKSGIIKGVQAAAKRASELGKK